VTRVPVRIVRSRFLWPPWVTAMVPVKRTILVRASANLDRRLLAHELRHVTQAETAAWPLAYALQWVATGFSYRNMPFEREARAAESDPKYLTWADDLLSTA